MYKNNDFIYDAVAKLEKLVKLPIDIESNRNEFNAIITLNDNRFKVLASSTIRNSNSGLIISKILNFTDKERKNILLVAKYISKTIAQDLREKNINYLDTAGNAYINNNNFFLFIDGQKGEKDEKNNQTRAFQEAGIKMLLFLLSNPYNLQLSYREIAEKTNISIGSVSNIMSELEEMNFVLKTSKSRVLKNKKELIERWVVAYNEVLKPRIIRKKMRLVNQKDYKTINLNELNEKAVWGGEPAGAILTNSLRPEKFILFTNTDFSDLGKKIGLIPDNNGDIEIYQMFWNEKNDTNIAPALLVYADLINSGFERNIETAKKIETNELQYIK
jgi:hypothetical protein